MLKKWKMTGLRWTWIVLLILIADRASKLLAVNYLTAFESYELLPVFNLTLAYNTGAAFSFLHEAAGWQNYLFGGLAIIVSGVIVIWLSRLSCKERLISIALCMIMGGALGNAWDRVLYGYVIDYFDFHLGNWHFAIFNIADSTICIGAILMIYQWLVAEKQAN